MRFVSPGRCITFQKSLIFEGKLPNSAVIRSRVTGSKISAIAKLTAGPATVISNSCMGLSGIRSKLPPHQWAAA